MRAYMAIETGEFRRLIETHQRMVFSIALRIIGDFATAQEVAQDVFLVLHRSGERLTSEDHTRFWLRRVTVHRATDALRRRAVRPETRADEWTEELHGGGAGANGSVVGMEARIDDVLRLLPESQRVAIVLRYQEDLLPDEIALTLGQPVATVKTHLRRGLELLRRRAAITLKEYVRGTT